MNSNRVNVLIQLSDQQQADLLRFCETCDDGEAYDVPNERLASLAGVGVVRACGPNRFAITDAGVATIMSLRASHGELAMAPAFHEDLRSAISMMGICQKTEGAQALIAACEKAVATQHQADAIFAELEATRAQVQDLKLSLGVAHAGSKQIAASLKRVVELAKPENPNAEPELADACTRGEYALSMGGAAAALDYTEQMHNGLAAMGGLIDEVLAAFQLEANGSCLNPGRDFIRPWSAKVAGLRQQFADLHLGVPGPSIAQLMDQQSS
ncbi:hypothetical protein [Pseudomonas sp. EMN2]|uniref:hypothetical protein n=1 Tax=Pseudomonas sp. EMN2 TaxID=2615212 RepID=UPI00129B466F|nr:hypothetical protein [Pseudomonas sp. EMN2]